MPSCFVIQPFDAGRFDKRFTDVFKAAIEDAGLDPYRVDRDPSVSIPINEIEQGIRNSAVCFADITLDNPNVWFELGFALASEKEICLICSKERVGKFPFDVQHRNIIHYDVDSPSDYHSLSNRITERLNAIQQKIQNLAVFSTNSLIREEGNLSRHEQIVLAAIVENSDGPGTCASHYSVKNSLELLGYNNLGLNVGLERLIRRQMITLDRRYEGPDDSDVYTTYYVSDSGMDWLIENYEALNPRK